MKTQVLLALGLSGVLAVQNHRHHRGHHAVARHHGHHGQGVNNRQIRQDIEQLRAAYNNLEHDYKDLSSQMKVANHKISQQFSSNAQMEGPAPNGLAGKGGPSLPAPQPFVRGEKQWMDNAQNIGDWGEQQQVVANSRIPYQSTAQKRQSMAQAQGPAPFGLAIETQGEGDKARKMPGPALPSPQPFVRGEKQWMDNAQNMEDWGDQQVNVANTRIPYQSVAQVEGPAPFGLAVEVKGDRKMAGPALPSLQPFVRGEKQWMDNAQNIGDWGDQQMTVANSRIPYASTVQLESQGPAPFGLASEVDGDKKPIPGTQGPALPSPQPFVRGEKQWMENAQNIGDWGDQQMTVANTRIPYQSTLVQTEETAPAPYGVAIAPEGTFGPAYPAPQPFVRGEKQWMENAQNIEDWGDHQMMMANTRIPYASTLLQTEETGPAPFGIAQDSTQLGGPAYPSPQPFVRGEKQWMDNAQNIEDWGIQQMTVANTRIPYQSTLVQTSDEDPEPDMSILYETEKADNKPEKVMSIASVPLNAEFIQTKAHQDDDPRKMEGMLMEDPKIPLNLRLLQLRDDDPSKMETMPMDNLDIPMNYRLLHVTNPQGDELIRII